MAVKTFALFLAVFLLSTVASAFAAEESVLAAPDQSYIGIWYTDQDKSDDLNISEITADAVKFEMGVFRTASISATAKIENNEIKFGPDISPDYSGPSLSGTLEFHKDSVSVAITESGFEYIKAGTVFNFTVKDGQ